MFKQLKREPISPKLRELVYRKYNGHCAYCGHEIDIKDMQVDHIVPVIHNGPTTLKNLNPSCRTCNHYKRDVRLESFKTWLLDGIVKRLSEIYIFKVALRYNMITINNWDHKFYYEKCEHYCGECKNYYATTITKIDGSKVLLEECRRECEEVVEVCSLQESCKDFSL